MSLMELRDSFLRSFYRDSSSSVSEYGALTARNSFDYLFQWLKSIVVVFHSSLFAGLFFILLFFRLSVTAVCKFFIKLLFVYPFQYLVFYFGFRVKYRRLKVTSGKKNVLCIIPSMVMGGAERAVLNLAKGVDRRKYVFHVMTTSEESHVWAGVFASFFQNVFSPKITKIQALYDYDTIYYKYFRFLMRKLNISVVLISHSDTAYKYLPRLKSSFRSLKIIDMLHVKNWPPRSMREGAAPYVDRRVCISQDLKDYVLNGYAESGLSSRYSGRLEVIYNGVDTREYSSCSVEKGKFRAKFSIPGDEKLVSFVGRFSEEKNPAVFVEIAKRVLAESDSKLKFVMAGDGPEFEKVHRMIENYDLQDRFVLPGMVQDVAELLNDTLILLVVSKTEGIPFVILEAMSMGVPVLSVDVGGISEVVTNGLNGFLISPRESVVDSFTEKVLELTEGQLNYDEISEKAKETIEARFTLNSMSSRYELLLDELTRI